MSDNIEDTILAAQAGNLLFEIIERALQSNPERFTATRAAMRIVAAAKRKSKDAWTPSEVRDLRLIAGSLIESIVPNAEGRNARK